MDTATPRPQSTIIASTQRRRGPPASLRIETPRENHNVALTQSGSSTSASVISSATSDTDSFILPSPTKPRTSRNMKKLSLTLPSAQSSTNSLGLGPAAEVSEPKRRLSVVSLPATGPTNFLRRRGEEEDNTDTVPYSEGPVQILPGIWLGSEENVRDWAGHRERGIKAILNVAKEVSTVFDLVQPLRPSLSTPNFKSAPTRSDPTYYPAHIASGRPAMYYLRLPWSHGQADLVKEGFPAAMAFVDQALERGDGVLIHCQCGISRSATLVIALVMRAASQRSPHVPSEVWALKGMHGAYSFVKEKSKAVGPNMSLIYQLLDYERTLSTGYCSPDPSDRSPSEEEWSRRRMMMEDTSTEDDRESIEVMREARALDQAMEHRLVARMSSASSLSSCASTNAPRRSRFRSRKRAGSIASVGTGHSILSEDLVEEDEERELLGIGGGFDGRSTEASYSSTEPTEDESGSGSRVSPESFYGSDAAMSSNVSQAPDVRMPPSAPHNRLAFNLPPVPATAIRSSFNLFRRSTPKGKPRRRPAPLGLLPPVPPSPVVPINPSSPASPVMPPDPAPIPPRSRTEARKPDIPPADLRTPRKTSHGQRPRPISMVSTPSQTLFVFPPSPTLTARTPSTLTLTSNAAFPFPSMATPRVSSFKADGRRRSFIGVPPPSTPTVASSRVDARGFFGMSR